MDTSSQTSEALELTNEELITAAVNNGEGVIANNGAFRPKLVKEQEEVQMIDLLLRSLDQAI